MVMILELHRQGISISAIARRVELDRKTVSRYIDRGLEPPAYGPRQRRVTQGQAVRALSARAAGSISAVDRRRRLHRELRDLGYTRRLHHP